MQIKKHRRAFVLVVLSTALLSGCRSFRGGVPAWVENPKAVYPESAYLAAVGEGDNRRSAENAATANLARIFEAHIESEERLVDRFHETDKALERTTDFSADINVLSAQTLYNIQHAESWTDNRGRVHAVAYLDRRETAALYRDKIAEQQKQVDALYIAAEQTDDPLKRYALLRAAVRHASEASRLTDQLKVIHPSSTFAPEFAESLIRRTLADTAKQIRVQIQMDGDQDRRMTSILEGLATRYGFVIGAPAVLDIDGRIAINDTGQRTADLVFVRFELSVQIRDAEGDVIAMINEKGREGHVSLSEARVRSYRTMENAVNASGVQRMDHYFDSLVDQAQNR